MAIYDLGTASLAANGEVTGVGTAWKAPLTLIRVGATIVFKTEPVKIYTISEIISDTRVNVYNPNSETVPAGTGYAILAHDGITVQGLAQDVAETLRYYQSKETSIESLLQFIGQDTFDWPRFEQLANQSITGAAEALASQVSSAESAATAVSARDTTTSARDATIEAINSAGDAGTLAYLASIGIGTTQGPAKTSLDWQTYDFIPGEAFAIEYEKMTNTPQGLVIGATGSRNIWIEVVALRRDSAYYLRVATRTGLNSLAIYYNVHISGAKGSRAFAVREDLSLEVDTTSGVGVTSGRVRGLLGVYSKNETFQKSLNFSDVEDKEIARANLDVYSKSETYEKSEVDSRLNKIVMYATEFGFGGTRQQNEDALYNIYLLLKNATSAITIKFPAGVFEIGSQQQSGSMGAGYAFRPSYLAREWEDESAAGWFSISNTDQAHTIVMTGCTLKLASGMKVGSFDPVTGSPYDQGAMETPLFDYNSNSGVMIKVRRAPNVTVIGGVTDGNLSGAVFGGKFGNSGYQTLCYNAWFNESLGVKVLGHQFINSAVDGVYFQHTTEFTRLNIVKRSLFKDCMMLNCGRNCFSLTGGRSIDIEDCIISGSGRLASGIGSNYSGPESCIDIEAESGYPDDINVYNTSLINAGKHSIYTVSTPNMVSNINFKNCTISSFHSEGAIANVGPTKGVGFSKCYIIGSIIDSGKQMLSDSYSFNDCEMLNNYGGTFADSYSLSFKVRSFVGNRITFGIPTANVTTPTVSIDDQDGVNFGVVSDRFKSNYLEVYGDASKVTFPNGLGGLNNFKSIELFVNSAGISNGTLKLLVDTSSVSLNGLTTNSTSFNFGTEMIKDDSQDVWFANTKTRVQSFVSASATNKIDIGSKSQAFSTIYMQKGVVFQDLVNPSSYYRLRVTNGAIELIQDV